MILLPFSYVYFIINMNHPATDIITEDESSRTSMVTRGVLLRAVVVDNLHLSRIIQKVSDEEFALNINK